MWVRITALRWTTFALFTNRWARESAHVCSERERDLPDKREEARQLCNKIQDAIEKNFKFRPEVIVRTTEEMRKAIAATPFADRPQPDPGKILVTFLADEPPREAQANLANFK